MPQLVLKFTPDTDQEVAILVNIVYTMFRHFDKTCIPAVWGRYQTSSLTEGKEQL